MNSEEFLQLKTLIQQNERHLLTNQRHLQKLVEHANRDRWYISFGSDVAANVLTTAGYWLFGRLFKK